MWNNIPDAGKFKPVIKKAMVELEGQNLSVTLFSVLEW